MAESKRVAPAVGDYPEGSFPTVYVDGLWSITDSTPPANLKMYFFRRDANFAGNGDMKINPVLQVVMPHEGFAWAAVHLRYHLDLLVDHGFISKDRVSEIVGVLEKAKRK